MSGPLKNGGAQMTITVQSHEVTLYFSSEPNSQVVSQVKQALLGTYLELLTKCPQSARNMV